MTADAARLLSGPRGRRLCMSVAAELDDGLHALIHPLAFEHEPADAAVTRIVFTGWGGDAEHAPEPPPPTVDGLVARLRMLGSADLAPERLAAAISVGLLAAVDSARYWQAPDGEDHLAALPAVAAALGGVAEQIMASTVASTWDAPRVAEQWAVDWRDAGDPAPLLAGRPGELLAEWGVHARADEARAARERPRDVTALYGGEWWSFPSGMLQTTGILPSGEPAGLTLVEDGFGWTDGVAIPVRGAGRTFEIRGPEDWVELCRRHPLDLTAARRHEWYRVTGRDGGWVIPDWERVAQEWDAVHLTALGYLTAATRELAVSEGYATVLGGWSPDVTVWLTDVAREWDAPRVAWHRERDGDEWMPVG